MQKNSPANVAGDLLNKNTRQGNMKIAIVTLKSVAPYSQSRHHDTPKKAKELPKDYEQRTWRERLHVNEDGLVFIPPTAFKNCLSEAAKFLSVQVPGKGKETWTKHFEAGVTVSEPLVLDLRKEDVEGEWLFLPSDGKRGGGKRVDKCYPQIKTWRGDVVFYITDSMITEEAFTDHISQAGNIIGIGRFRPRNNGFYGRFVVERVKWQEAG